jgi:integrase
MPLTDAKLRSLKPGDRPRKISDFEGLHIVVMPNGARLWRLAYRFHGKQKQLAIGSYPDVSLSDARDARQAARKQLLAGVDPGAERQAEKRRARIAAADTFKAVAEEWFENQDVRWRISYSSRLRSRLDRDLLPKLGSRPIADIEPIEVLEVIRSIERRDALEVARRAMQMASAIFRYGVATSRCARDPTVDLRGALKAPRPTEHQSSISAKELPEFLRRLGAYSGQRQTQLALELVVLTFVRTSELRFARWSELEGLEGPEPLWRIPAERMKMRRPHLVPLAPQAVEVLRELRRFSGRSEYVLPSATRSRVISENTLIYGLYRLGYHGRATVHGFRSTASTILNEHQFNRDWIEMQLAHADNKIRSAYNAAEWLPGRRKMMCWWADYLDCARAGMDTSPAANDEAVQLPAAALSLYDRARGFPANQN